MPPAFSPKKYVSVAEAARMFGISRIAVFKKIKKGQIPALLVGHSYSIAWKDIAPLIEQPAVGVLTPQNKGVIQKAVSKVVQEYGETLRLLGKE